GEVLAEKYHHAPKLGQHLQKSLFIPFPVERQLPAVIGLPLWIQVEDRRQTPIGSSAKGIHMLLVEAAFRIAGVMAFVVKQAKEESAVDALAQLLHPGKVALQLGCVGAQPVNAIAALKAIQLISIVPSDTRLAKTVAVQ